MLEVVFHNGARGSMRVSGLFDFEDIYSFDLELSIGDIAVSPFGPVRQKLLGRLYCLEDGEVYAKKDLARQEENLNTLLTRWEQGEDLRVWYSLAPFEACGLRWLMDGLDSRPGPGKLWAVRLPAWELRPDGETMVSMTGWGEVSPQEWGKYFPLKEEVPPVLQKALAGRWRELQRENAPLRAVVNGRLVSVPETFYDSFIQRTLSRQPKEFREAVVIGETLGRYQLGISDGWLAQRIEAMVEAGQLEVLGHEPGRDELSYARYLRKTDCFPGE